jgi:SAM-dependent methyltransferase
MTEKGVSEALNEVAKLYGDNLASHGVSAKSVGWRDDETQLLRFAKLCEVIDPSSEFTVNDLGCGYGAMFKYLADAFGSKMTAYRGYDISPEMLSAAGAFINDPRAELLPESELSRKADYSFVSGTFNVRMAVSEGEWRDHVERSVRNLAEYSNRGFAFNLLTTYVDWKQENLYYADPLQYFDYCKKNISRFVTLIHDYPLHEWTLVVRL